MKRGKRLTRNQKIIVKNQGYDPKNYVLMHELEDRLLLKEKKSEIRLLLDKPKRGGKNHA